MFEILGYLSVGVSVLYQSVALFVPRLHKRRIIAIVNILAALFLLLVIIQRSLQIEFIALTSTFESLLFYSLMILLITGGYALQKKWDYLPPLQFFVTVCALGLLLVATSPLFGKEALPPIPALRSAWLLLHVAFAFIGESFFVFAFVTSLLLLCTKPDREKRIHLLDRLTYISILIGYAFFTLGALVFGAIWAEVAWGAFWSWDPKETWALITWLVYSLYLHFRIFRKSNRRVCAWISVIGFLCTLFTFFGVNYLLNSMHSYG